MKWFEVVSGCDGYYSPSRFRTMQEAEAYVSQVEESDDDLIISQGPYEVDTDDALNFFSEVDE